MDAPPQSLDSSLGAAFIGVIAAAMLFGISNMQTLIYFQSRSKDPLLLRIMVAVLWVLDLLHMILITEIIYNTAVRNFTNLAAVGTPTWSFRVHIIVALWSNLIVRFFYARRIWILSRHNWILTITPALAAIFTVVCGTVFMAKSVAYTSYMQFDQVAYLIYLAFGSGVITDVFIAATICYYLNRHRTGFSSSDAKIDIITAFIVNSGLLTSVCMICSLASFAIRPHTLIYLAFYFVLSKLSFNSLLATLNARDRLQDNTASAHGVNFHIGENPQVRSGTNESCVGNIQVQSSQSGKQDDMSPGHIRSPPGDTTPTSFFEMRKVTHPYAGAVTHAFEKQGMDTADSIIAPRLDTPFHRRLAVRVETVTCMDDSSDQESDSLNRRPSSEKQGAVRGIPPPV